MRQVRRIAFFISSLSLLPFCVPPGQVRRHTTPGHLKKRIKHAEHERKERREERRERRHHKDD